MLKPCLWKIGLRQITIPKSKLLELTSRCDMLIHLSWLNEFFFNIAITSRRFTFLHLSVYAGYEKMSKAKCQSYT